MRTAENPDLGIVAVKRRGRPSEALAPVVAAEVRSVFRAISQEVGVKQAAFDKFPWRGANDNPAKEINDALHRKTITRNTALRLIGWCDQMLTLASMCHKHHPWPHLPKRLRVLSEKMNDLVDAIFPSTDSFANTAALLVPVGESERFAIAIRKELESLAPRKRPGTPEAIAEWIGARLKRYECIWDFSDEPFENDDLLETLKRHTGRDFACLRALGSDRSVDLATVADVLPDAMEAGRQWAVMSFARLSEALSSDSPTDNQNG